MPFRMGQSLFLILSPPCLSSPHLLRRKHRRGVTVGHRSAPRRQGVDVEGLETHEVGRRLSFYDDGGGRAMTATTARRIGSMRAVRRRSAGVFPPARRRRAADSRAEGAGGAHGGRGRERIRVFLSRGRGERRRTNGESSFFRKTKK